MLEPAWSLPAQQVLAYVESLRRKQIRLKEKNPSAPNADTVGVVARSYQALAQPV